MTRDFAEYPVGATPMTELPLDFEAFHRMHRPAYVRWAKTYLNNQADAEEAVDCAFEQLLMAWPDVLAKDSPAAYAWQVMKNRTVDAGRARGRREALVDTAASRRPYCARRSTRSASWRRASPSSRRSRPCPSGSGTSPCCSTSWGTPSASAPTISASRRRPCVPPPATQGAACRKPSGSPRKDTPMTSHIDQLLAKARLVNDPYPQEDINAAAERIAARVAARRAEPAPPTGLEPCGPPQPAGHAGAGVAAQDLRTLCETAVMSTGALASLQHFVARSLPEPSGARVLGCVLQLTEREDAARFWWQYAAGAGDSPAVYCLYLHHMAHGERGKLSGGTPRWKRSAPAMKKPGHPNWPRPCSFCGA